MAGSAGRERGWRVIEGDLLVVALAVLAFGLLAGRLHDTSLTMPMLFTAAGLALGPDALGVIDLGLDDEVVGVLAEAALVVVLFTDAARLDLAMVRRQHQLAQRLLVFGLPLAVLLGWGAGTLLLPGLTLAAAALLAATLAPTDAALGQAFVTAQGLPARIRQTINVESGLNDGLALPFIAILLDLALDEARGPQDYAIDVLQIVGLGTLVGIGLGIVGGRLLMLSADRGWSTAPAERLGVLAVAATAYAGAEVIGGNGFVAAFVAGLAFGRCAQELTETAAIFGAAEGQLLTLLTFLFFGALLAPAALAATSWQVLGYALVSLLVVRPIAVVVSLLGTQVAWRTTVFLGWAGPRGLASIVYLVLIAEASAFGGQEEVVAVGSWVVLLSIFLHGVSAAWLSRAYGAWVHRSKERCSTEHTPVSELPVRLRGRSGPGVSP